MLEGIFSCVSAHNPGRDTGPCPWPVYILRIILSYKK